MADKSAWDERYAAKELVWSSEPNQLFKRAVDSLTPGSALDIACGGVSDVRNFAPRVAKWRS